MTDDNAKAQRTRRDLLETVPAPQPRHDAVVTLRLKVTPLKRHEREITARLRYVPDRDVLTHQSFGKYINALQLGKVSLEEAATLIIEDVMDQVIPCWLEVRLSYDQPNHTHAVRVEDRQPRWQDRGILDRLEP